MALQVGLVGLPNVGKSTLFNALLARQVAEAANYPFCTIDPNVGVVEVPDDRLPVLAEVVGTEKIVPAAVEFVDIAGLVEGAHKGEGLGNKFLSHIREVDAIILVLRDFSDPNVVRSGSTTPESDAQVLLTELQLADLQTLEKITAPRANATKEEQIRFQAVEKLRTALENNQSTQTVTLTDEEEFEIKSFGLLTRKPIIIVLNTDEKNITQPTEKILDFPTLRLCAKLEAEMAGMELSERKELLLAYGIEKPILDILIRTAYQTLGLITFLTAGVKEVRAWPIVAGTKAPQAAATIHTDFETGFIKAQIANYQDFIDLKGWKGVKDAGKVRFEGKEYVMHESDIVEFMVNT